MTQNTNLIWGFYFAALLLTVLSGLIFGFVDSHTVPAPFLLGVFFVGLTWGVTDLIIFLLRKTGASKTLLAHSSGLIINALLVFYILH